MSDVTALVGKRRGAWWGAGRGFAVGAPYTQELLLLDFGRRAPGGDAGERVTAPATTQLAGSAVTRMPMAMGAISSLGVNPRTDEMVLGGAQVGAPFSSSSTPLLLCCRCCRCCWVLSAQ